ncbi:recombinational DNA repair ATPase RecF [Clavibacter michiganensis]|nr:recombinational DNA repair ATPase RecF [Clavibacter michiganensis]
MTNSSAPVFIKQVALEHFRGIGGPLTLALTSQPAGSALLMIGDNGAGKSSICDALEFATRGVVSRRTFGGEKNRREIKNLSAKLPPSVELLFSDGVRVRRGGRQASWGPLPQGGVHIKDKSPMDGYELAPVVIRRDAVESFWRVPAQERLGYFWDYTRVSPVGFRTREDTGAIVAYEQAEKKVNELERSLLDALELDSWPGLFKLPEHTRAAELALTKTCQNIMKDRRARSELTADERAEIKKLVQSIATKASLRSAARTAQTKPERDTKLLRELLEAVSNTVKADFYVITGMEWFQDVNFTISESGELRIMLSRARGRSLEPTDVLSEASLDLLALLILVELHLACADHGQSKVLVLDDVFQSVDSTLRGRALAHLATRLQGWQLILTFHDRLWLERAERAFRDADYATSVIELRNGGYGATPTVLGANVGPLRDLRHSLGSGASAVTVAGVAGRALEAICDRLSIELEASVRRKSQDRYGIQDLLDGLKKEIDIFEDSRVGAAYDRLSETQFLRNRLGAHYSAWGDSLSDTEAREAAAIVLNFWELFTCVVCEKFHRVKKTHDKKWRITSHCQHNGVT